MRFIILYIHISILLIGCNSSGKRESDQKKDTTAGQNNTPSLPGKIEPLRGTAADITPGIKVKGDMQEVWKWSDKLGNNLLITTLVQPYDDKEKNKYGEEGKSAELYAYHFAGVNGEYKQVWLLNEAEKTCPFDITCEFIRDAISITDLDADKEAEITLQYKLACRSDVSPAVMKLVMYEGETKYTLQGLTWYGSPGEKFEITENNANLETLPGYKKTEEDFYKTWGRYESEKEFANAPPAFLHHARSRWVRFVKESNE